MRTIKKYGLLATGLASLVLPCNAADWLAGLPMIGNAAAEEVSGTVSGTAQVAASSGGRASTSAVVRLLDKQTGRSQTLTMVAGQPQTVNTLTLTMNKCFWDYKARSKLDVAWLDVHDTAMTDKGFQGWMFNQFPDVATMDHPRYDVQLESCVTPAGTRRLLPSTVTSTVPKPSDTDISVGGGDDEAPGASEAPQGTTTVPVVPDREPGAVPPALAPDGKPSGPDSDPYYVPGVEPQAGPVSPSAREPARSFPQEPAPDLGEDQQLQQMMDGQ